MTKPRRKPNRGDEGESGRVLPGALPLSTPLYPFGAFPMTPPIYPYTGEDSLSDEEETEFWDL